MSEETTKKSVMRLYVITEAEGDLADRKRICDKIKNEGGRIIRLVPPFGLLVECSPSISDECGGLLAWE